MTKLFLSLHVLAALLAIGPVTVAASMFPRVLRGAHSDTDGHEGITTLRLLHRICRVYAALGLAIPVFGFATASSLGVLGSGWLIASIILTAAAAAILALLILPAQDSVLDLVQAPEPSPSPSPGPSLAVAAAGRLAMLTGVFNLLWATVTVLMIVRPGSTTGA